MSCLEFNFKLRYTQTNIYGVLLYRVTLVHLTVMHHYPIIVPIMNSTMNCSEMKESNLKTSLPQSSKINFVPNNSSLIIKLIKLRVVTGSHLMFHSILYL